MDKKRGRQMEKQEMENDFGATLDIENKDEKEPLNLQITDIAAQEDSRFYLTCTQMLLMRRGGANNKKTLIRNVAYQTE